MPTYINIQNNLNTSLTVSTSVAPPLDSKYWGIDSGVAIFGQSTKILQMNRNIGIKNGKNWVFTTALNLGGTTVQLQESLTGTLLSSDIAVQIIAGNQDTGWQKQDTELTFPAADGTHFRVTATYKLNGTYDDVTYGITQFAGILPQIEHVVVLMNENRSLDNLLGWLYADGTQPSQFLPPGSPNAYNGLAPNTYFNTNASVNGGKPVYASEGTTSWSEGSKTVSEWYIPSPDPGEEFDHVTTQIFDGAGTGNMGGFITDYLTQTGAESAAQIMQSYKPSQLKVINTLAKSFAVSDEWFCSVPSQTWPNRGFVQTGSSDGHTNNDLPKGLPLNPWDIYTIFDVLGSQDLPWAVYNDGALQSLTKTMFLTKYEFNETNFLGIKEFQAACAQPASAPINLKLPVFSFIEPDFGVTDSKFDESYHPPHDVRPGEQFLAKIYNTLADCPYRDNILFIVLFDEHGGTYDHVVPKDGAQPPSPHPVATDGSGFTFDRFGVRVPAIVISSWVKSGTVFRSNNPNVPLDHTSVLATLRDWLGLSDAFKSMLPSPRIAAAPNLGYLLTETTPQLWPSIPTPTFDLASIESPSDDQPLNDVQRAILLGAAQMKAGGGYKAEAAGAQFEQLRTHGDARVFMKYLQPHLPLK